MKLQAVMETLLQRQQRARQELEARQPPEPPAAAAAAPPPAPRARAPTEDERDSDSARMQRAQMAALAAMRAAAAGLGHAAGASSSEEEEAEAGEAGATSPSADAGEGPGAGDGDQDEGSENEVSEDELKPKWEEEEEEELEEEEEDEEEDYEEDDEEGLGPPGPAALFPRKAQPPPTFRSGGDGPRALGSQERAGAGPAASGGAAHVFPPLQPPDHGDWTYEEQFKQLYELDGDPKRKEFLDDLFSFMQKRGTPVNRIPIMAKQVLDLFMLYVLVTEKGGLVEVINKKLWREITKGLNLPTSITSAAFTLRTQYMKYLYPYECEKRGLSNPNELQAAIDSNRREGRRQSFGGSLFAYSPGGAHVLPSPKLPVPALGLTASTNGSAINPAPKIKKEEDSAIPITVPGRLPVSLASHPVVAAQAAAVQAAAAAQAAALEQLREKLESGEPPEKKMALVSDEQQRLMQRALQQNFLAMTAQLPMSIRINSQASESRQDAAVSVTGPNGSNSISMSVEINGVMYTGVLFAQPSAPTPSTAPSKGSSRGGSSGSGGGSGGGSSGSNSSGGGGSSSQAGSAGLCAPPTSTSNNSLP
ncbi:AT-rich interactive domain-containing protein 3A [Sorex araneus]|uniref:AT-rich interactive domain-containing protein 3A n=1 Tax=Sorex araneus TaxID=42254 RepID=UPI002433B060|nr:AT-rich interactive domain-containing protein 3A [Sorex araneus]XP_054984954.1 AT-rich interactive domain-containing protein 3A [Sorex araneus]XP_054984955.1 AT-rich interactive domain-containing protein 3A [Sorex araneus]XP_054984956.1 AT-rich interactive domain-containing protein 3A [Sorex araneus]